MSKGCFCVSLLTFLSRESLLKLCSLTPVALTTYIQKKENICCLKEKVGHTFSHPLPYFFYPGNQSKTYPIPASLKHQCCTESKDRKKVLNTSSQIDCNITVFLYRKLFHCFSHRKKPFEFSNRFLCGCVNLRSSLLFEVAAYFNRQCYNYS